ncbi:MAG: hypothetical protein ABIP97_03095 [Chthoniobacterales bacterium]
MKFPPVIFAAVALASIVVYAQTSAPTRVPVVFSGGHDTDPQDKGRPVILVASALGVKSEVFREAFTRVHPAGEGQEPSPEQRQANKAALLSALSKYSVTNERLDEVSNYYRYAPGRGEMWPVKPATANALVQNGKVTGYEITDGGSGYSSPPIVTVPKMESAKSEVQLSFGKDFKTNGSVSVLTIAK